MHTNERLRRLAHGEQGAIMVMGLFMCSCLVGALWYLAGIGDAILLRERAQEAADAMAFSDAALHARGMNLIVLVNLVMACILGVRVALKIARTVCLAAAAAFGSLGLLWPPLVALATPCMAAAETLETLITASREPINQSLRALSLTQDVISATTPTAARVGAHLMAGDKYAPAVTSVGVAHVGSETSLPIASGSQDKLCKEAGHAAGFIATWTFEKAGLGGIDERGATWLGDKFAWLASTSPLYFCELGSATGEPDMNEIFTESAKTRCENSDVEKERHSLEETEDAWQEKCRAYGVLCTGTDDRGNLLEKGTQRGEAATPAEGAELERLRLVRDQQARSAREYTQRFGWRDVPQAECERWAIDDAKRRQQEQNDLSKELQQQEPSGASEGENDVTPKKVDPDFHNGHAEAQIIGGALLDASRLGRSSRIVRIGAWNRASAASTPSEGAELPSWAQAEFFYDCVGKWERCNEDEDAMWHLKWRPRLRRWNEPVELYVAIAEMGFFNVRLDLTRFAARAQALPAGAYAPNAALRVELARALAATRLRGVH